MTFIKEAPESGAFEVDSRVWFVFAAEAGAGTITDVDVDSPVPFHVVWDNGDGNGWYPSTVLRLVVPVLK